MGLVLNGDLEYQSVSFDSGDLGGLEGMQFCGFVKLNVPAIVFLTTHNRRELENRVIGLQNVFLFGSA
jgi:hypothetical protein